MKKTIAWIIFGCWSLMGWSQQPSISFPEPVSTATGGCLSAELIFLQGTAPFRSCHAPTLAETSEGLVSAWFGGSREGASDVGIWVSREQSGSWSEPVRVAVGSDEGSRPAPCWNPVLFPLKGGPLLLFYKVGPSPREWWGEWISSQDDGKSWGPASRLGNGRLGPLIGPVKNKPILLGDTLLLCPSSTERIEAGEVFWTVHFERMNLRDRSWRVSGPINDGSVYDIIQPTILCHSDGSLQALCRSRQDVIVQSWSTDQGRSWSNPSPASLPNPNSGIDGITLSDGRHLLVFNPTRRGSSGNDRGILVVAVSGDGVKWETVWTLENKQGEYSYPAVIQTTDGLIHISYTYNRKAIKHVVLDPAFLPGY